MDVSTIVIDFGGVLVRTESRRSRQSWENRLGLEDGALDAIVFDSEVAREATLGKATEEDIWRYIQNKLSLTNDEISQLKIDFWREDLLDNDLVNTLKKLRKKYQTAILSNIWTGGREFFRNHYGLGEKLTVDRIFVSCEMGLAKPDPEIFRCLAREMDVQFDKILFIDDFKANITAALALGINAHHFCDPDETISLLNSLVDSHGS